MSIELLNPVWETTHSYSTFTNIKIKKLTTVTWEFLSNLKWRKRVSPRTSSSRFNSIVLYAASGVSGISINLNYVAVLEVMFCQRKLLAWWVNQITFPPPFAKFKTNRVKNMETLAIDGAMRLVSSPDATTFYLRLGFNSGLHWLKSGFQP